MRERRWAQLPEKRLEMVVKEEQGTSRGYGPSFFLPHVENKSTSLLYVHSALQEKLLFS